MSLIGFLIVGLIAGALARLLVPGEDPLGILGTLLLGIVGSFVGGFLAALFQSDRDVFDFTTTGLIGSVIGAVVALLVYRSLRSSA